MVTAPTNCAEAIQKCVLFIGHTEIFQELTPQRGSLNYVSSKELAGSFFFTRHLLSK